MCMRESRIFCKGILAGEDWFEGGGDWFYFRRLEQYVVASRRSDSGIRKVEKAGGLQKAFDCSWILKRLAYIAPVDFKKPGGEALQP